MAKKKKKRSPGEMHRQIQDSIQALPYVIDQERKRGHRVRAFMLRFFTGPVLRTMNRLVSASRYRGEEGAKLKQTEQMRRHLQHKQQAVKHVQTHMQDLQKRRRPM